MTAPVSQPQSYTQRYLNFLDRATDKIENAARAGIQFVKNYPKTAISIVGLVALAILAAVWTGHKATLTAFTFVLCLGYTFFCPFVLIGAALNGRPALTMFPDEFDEEDRIRRRQTNIIVAVYMVSIPILWVVWAKFLR